MFTPKSSDYHQFYALCEGVNTIFWELNAYIRVRVRRNHPVKAWVKVMAFLQVCISCFHTIRFHSVPIIGFLRLTSPGLFFTTRRLEQNSPGLVGHECPAHIEVLSSEILEIHFQEGRRRAAPKENGRRESNGIRPKSVG